MNIRVNSSLDSALIERLDITAKKCHITRSALMTILLNNGLNAFDIVEEMGVESIQKDFDFDFDNSVVDVKIPINKINRKTEK